MNLDAWLEKLRLAWGEGRTELVSELSKDIPRLWKDLEGKRAQKLEMKVLSRQDGIVVVSWEYVNHLGRESAGVLWLRFDGEGFCKVLKMWWMAKE